MTINGMKSNAKKISFSLMLETIQNINSYYKKETAGAVEKANF
jgi:hypothetical protein